MTADLYIGSNLQPTKKQQNGKLLLIDLIMKVIM